MGVKPRCNSSAAATSSAGSGCAARRGLDCIPLRSPEPPTSWNIVLFPDFESIRRPRAVNHPASAPSRLTPRISTDLRRSANAGSAALAGAARRVEAPAGNRLAHRRPTARLALPVPPDDARVGRSCRNFDVQRRSPDREPCRTSSPAAKLCGTPRVNGSSMPSLGKDLDLASPASTRAAGLLFTAGPLSASARSPGPRRAAGTRSARARGRC